MGNITAVARKEFVGLLNNRIVLFILIVYLCFVAFLVWDFKVVSSGGKPGTGVMYDDNPGVAAVNNIFYTLTWMGTIIGIIIGCSTISSERMGNALNTLIVKPLYRDTIINGKLLGSFVFMVCFIILTILIYTLGFLILCGNYLAPYYMDYFSRLLFVFVFAVVYMSVFLSISVLVALLVKDQAFAIFISTLTVYISVIICFPNISSCLDKVLPGFKFHQLSLEWSPNFILVQMQDKLMNTSKDALDAFLDVLPYMEKLVIFVVIAIILSYIIFVRTDIT